MHTRRNATPDAPEEPVRRLLAALGAGQLGSAELQRRLDCSQPTVSRLLRRAGGAVVALGRGRATRYAAAQEVFGSGLSQPIYLVGESGAVAEVGRLRALLGGGYVVEAPGGPFWLLGAAGTGVFESLPYYLFDARPAGFLGRQIARALAGAWGAPPDPRDWTDAHIGVYLLREGHDLPGNVVLGEAAAQRVHQLPPTPVSDRATAYPRLANAALSDALPGSSAAGEQPKFLAQHAEVGPVIVKFSPSGDSVDAVRWRDLLRAEHHALELLRAQGIPAALTSCHNFDGRTFLEGQRFDRCGVQGRRPVISLAMVDAEYAGEGHGWTRIAAALQRAGRIGAASFASIVWAETFGCWIGNTDMHAGNISLGPSADGFALLPLYDMLPMALAPERGELLQRPLTPPLRTPANEGVWEETRRAAEAYWGRVADDPLLSPAFRNLAGEAAVGLRRWAA